MNPIECIPCRTKKSLIYQRLYWLQQQTKTRAVNEDTTYAIWFDTEDQKYLSGVLSDNEDKRTNYDFQVISKHP